MVLCDTWGMFVWEVEMQLMTSRYVTARDCVDPWGDTNKSQMRTATNHHHHHKPLTLIGEEKAIDD